MNLLRRLRTASLFWWVWWSCLVVGKAQTTNPFEAEIRAFEAADARTPPPADALLFVGSSSIRMWTGLAGDFPEFNVLNRGFGGSQAGDVLFFFDRVVVPYRPPLIVYYEGDNDLAAGRPVEAVFADWTEFVVRVRAALPETHVVFVAVKPSPSRRAFQNAMRTLNERVRDHCATDPQLHFADVFTPMLDAAGQPRSELFLADNLHMNAAGYALWKAVLTPMLQQWAEAFPRPVRKPRTGTLLIDLGSADHPSGGGGGGTIRWNNVTPSIGASSSGVLSPAVATDGTPTGVALRMVSRFNGANENGTVAATGFPAPATRDSLFGNTETFSGLANVTPVFRLAGLGGEKECRLTFYASRLGVGDNRETRYTVTGSTTMTADLNVAGNVETTAVIPNVRADAAGELEIALSPGPNNSNANHFTYLGVLQVEVLGTGGSTLLFDFGAAATPTGEQPAPGGPLWNNLTEAVGTTAAGELADLSDTDGLPTGIALRMVRRFNGANLNGTTAAESLPASATRDSLFGNTEPFNGLAEVRPAFRLTGLDPAGLYALTFHASRTGVGDNREARYTVTGGRTNALDLDAANNAGQSVTLTNAQPDLDGTLLVELAPGPNNDNANHFIYLGALRVEWSVPAPFPPRLGLVHPAEGPLGLLVRARRGRRYQLESSADLVRWSSIQEVRLDADSAELLLPPEAEARFLRLVE